MIANEMVLGERHQVGFVGWRWRGAGPSFDLLRLLATGLCDGEV
jgi:hypothetical protein